MARQVNPSIHTRSTNPRAAVAALLSFLFPGLGQAYNGQAGLAWLMAGPAIVLVFAVVVVMAAGSSRVLAHLFDFRFLVGLVVLDGVLLAWRLIAVAQAHGRRERPTPRSWATWLTALVLIATLAMHGLPAYYAAKAIDTLDAVALGGVHSGDVAGGFSYFSGLPQPSGQPDVAVGERVNILLVGVDSAPGRTTALTDTMLVVSLDPSGTRSAMISVPRDLYGTPLPDGTFYNAKLNTLMVRAAARPEQYPLGGVGTLKAAIGELLGVPIHYFAAINLIGFKQTVDAIGGVDVTVEKAVSDPTYFDEFGKQVGFFIKPGVYHMDGRMALAFARSRKGAGDNDFTRSDRQQQLLTAIRAELTAGNLLLTLPTLLDAVKNTIATDVPSDRIADLALAVQGTDMSQLERIVLQPPQYMTADPFSSAGYVLIPDLEAIRAIGAALLGAVQPSHEPSQEPFQ